MNNQVSTGVGKPGTVLFDIDGTLADIAHRRHFIEGDRRDWKNFNDRMGDDTTNEPVVALYKALQAGGQFELIIVTGRNARYRKVTEQWLIWNEIVFETLLMRAENDHRVDYLVKQDILKSLQEAGHEIAFTVDDRQQVVDMWRRNGIVCLQCDVGDF
ncbi:MAG: hypothetical protein JKY49_09210 [Cohaesibacteraceae bacterium]|nr:hypothetical protein [Cohaesibacteraceae bacterium]